MYRGSDIPWLVGKYVFADLTRDLTGGFVTSGKLFVIDPYDEQGNLREPDNVTIEELTLVAGDRTGTINISFMEDENGELYVIGVGTSQGTIVRLLPGPAPFAGDYDGDGFIGQGDLDLVLLHWGSDGTEPPDGWINMLPDGNIDQEELDAVLLNWGASFDGDGQTGPAGVPEPASISLILLGGLLLARCMRRRR